MQQRRPRVFDICVCCGWLRLKPGQGSWGLQGKGGALPLPVIWVLPLAVEAIKDLGQAGMVAVFARYSLDAVCRVTHGSPWRWL